MKSSNKLSSKPYLLQTAQPHLSLCLHRGDFHSSNKFHGPPLDLLQQVHVIPVLRIPELNTGLWAVSHQTEVEGENFCFDLLSTLSLMHPGIWLAIWAVSTHCHLTFGFSSISTSNSCSAGLLSIPLSLRQYSYQGVPWPLCRMCHLALWNLMISFSTYLWA